MGTYLIVGLGNPGREYRDTRHNIGYLVIDRLAEKLGCKIGKLQQKALLGNAVYQNHKVILAKPVTYMNNSGLAAAGLIRYYKIEQPNFLVVHDDIDLPFGALRLRPDGGSAGQKGMSSIIEQAGTNEFARLRFGIGRPPGRMEAASYVLENFRGADLEELPGLVDTAATAILTYIEFGLETAMNRFNTNGLKE